MGDQIQIIETNDAAGKQEPLIYNPTINQQIRNRKIQRNEKGYPLIKEPIKAFVPVNPAEGKKSIKNDVFTIFDNEYDSVKI